MMASQLMAACTKRRYLCPKNSNSDIFYYSFHYINFDTHRKFIYTMHHSFKVYSCLPADFGSITLKIRPITINKMVF